MRHLFLPAWSAKRETDRDLGVRKKHNSVLRHFRGKVPALVAGRRTTNRRSLNTTTHTNDILKDIAMLVLSRKESEKIMLGDSIVLTIVRVSGDRVRLGIEAPSDMLILRKELEDSDNKPGSKSVPLKVAPPAAA